MQNMKKSQRQNRQDKTMSEAQAPQINPANLWTGKFALYLQSFIDQKIGWSPIRLTKFIVSKVLLKFAIYPMGYAEGFLRGITAIVSRKASCVVSEKAEELWTVVKQLFKRLF